MFMFSLLLIMHLIVHSFASRPSTAKMKELGLRVPLHIIFLLVGYDARKSFFMNSFLLIKSFAAHIMKGFLKWEAFFVSEGRSYFAPVE